MQQDYGCDCYAPTNAAMMTDEGAISDHGVNDERRTRHKATITAMTKAPMVPTTNDERGTRRRTRP
jgi:hypothetical protein